MSDKVSIQDVDVSDHNLLASGCVGSEEFAFLQRYALRYALHKPHSHIGTRRNNACASIGALFLQQETIRARQTECKIGDDSIQAVPGP